MACCFVVPLHWTARRKGKCWECRSRGGQARWFDVGTDTSVASYTRSSHEAALARRGRVRESFNLWPIASATLGVQSAISSLTRPRGLCQCPSSSASSNAGDLTSARWRGRVAALERRRRRRNVKCSNRSLVAVAGAGSRSLGSNFRLTLPGQARKKASLST